MRRSLLVLINGDASRTGAPAPPGKHGLGEVEAVISLRPGERVEATRPPAKAPLVCRMLVRIERASERDHILEAPSIGSTAFARARESIFSRRRSSPTGLYIGDETTRESARQDARIDGTQLLRRAIQRRSNARAHHLSRWGRLSAYAEILPVSTLPAMNWRSSIEQHAAPHAAVPPGRSWCRSARDRRDKLHHEPLGRRVRDKPALPHARSIPSSAPYAAANRV